VTICAQDRVCLFGDVVGDAAQHNDAGRMVVEQWEALPTRFSTISLDAFVVMPNHLHGILIISPRRKGELIHHMARAGAGQAIEGAVSVDGNDVHRSPTLGDVIGAFKSITTVEYGRGVEAENWPRYRDRLWQRNYHERIIRDEDELIRIRQYIAHNPANWAIDPENPDNR